MIIKFKTAKLAKKAGFNNDSKNYYESTGKLNGISGEEMFNAPTQSELQKWLREKHDILVYVDPRRHHIFQYHIITHDDEIIGSERLNNWEKVLEKGLRKSLKLIK